MMQLEEVYEGCEKMGGICDCGDRQCAVLTRERDEAREDHRRVVVALAETRAEVERLQAAIDRAHGAMHGSEYVGGPTERKAWRTAFAVLSEVVTEHKGQT